jgi:hypothetical protein
MFVHDIQCTVVVIEGGVAVALGGLRSFLRVSQHDVSVTQSGVCENPEAALIYISGIIECSSKHFGRFRAFISPGDDLSALCQFLTQMCDSNTGPDTNGHILGVGRQQKHSHRL